MRNSPKQEFLSFDNTFCGILLQADFCAEHEWGIADLKQKFGHDDTKLGIEGRRITKLPYGFKFLEDQNYALLTSAYDLPDDFSITQEIKKKNHIFNELYIYPKEKFEIKAKWCGNDFLILVAKQHISKLKLLSEAFSQKDIAFYLGKSETPFGNAGLIFTIISKSPEAGKQHMYNVDLDNLKLKEAVQKIDVTSKVRSQLGVYALTPKWKKEFSEDRFSSKFEMVFWLNPQHQQAFNYGWYTVEELELALQGRGPICNFADYQEKMHHQDNTYYFIKGLTFYAFTPQSHVMKITPEDRQFNSLAADITKKLKEGSIKEVEGTSYLDTFKEHLTHSNPEIREFVKLFLNES